MSKGFFQNLYDYSIGGVLRKPIKQMTGLSDAQMAGAGLLAVAAPYALPAVASGAPAAGAAQAGATAGATEGGGLLSTLGSAGKPLLGGAQVGLQVAEMMKPQPMQPGQLAQRPGPDLSQFIAAEQQRNQMMDQERQKRMQQQQMALGGLLGGGYGRNA